MTSKVKAESVDLHARLGSAKSDNSELHGRQGSTKPKTFGLFSGDTAREKIKNISSILKIILHGLTGASASVITESPKSNIKLADQKLVQFDDLCGSVQVLMLFITLNTDGMWALLNSARTLNVFLNAFKSLSEIEVNISSLCPSHMKIEEFDEKRQKMALSMATAFTLYLKRENSENYLISCTLLELVLKPLPKQEIRVTVWRQSAAQVLQLFLKSKRFNAEHFESLRKGRQFESLCKIFKQACETKSLDFAVQVFQIIMSLFSNSHQNNSELLKCFGKMQGYKTLGNLLADNHTSDNQNILLDSLMQLASMGPEDVVENVAEIDKDSPFQISGFMIPIFSNDFQFRNLNCLEIYIRFFEGINVQPVGTMRQEVSEQLLQLIQMNPINYFVISGNSNIVCRMIEVLDDVDKQLKQVALAILKHIVVVIGYVPYKELSLLFSHLHGFSAPDTTELVCKTLIMFLENTPLWRDTLRDLGLVNTLSSLVLFIEKEAAGINTPPSWEVEKFQLSPAINQNFELLMKVLEELLQNSQNLVMFRETTKNALLNLLKFKEYSRSVVVIVRKIIRKNSASEAQENQVELGQIIETLKITQDSTVSRLLIELLKDLLQDSHEVQTHFRGLQGYEQICQSLHTHKGKESETIEYLKSWFKVVFNSMLSNEENQGYLKTNLPKLNIADGMINQVSTEKHASIVLRGFLGILLKNESIFQEFDFVYKKEHCILETTFASVLFSCVRNLLMKGYNSVCLPVLQYSLDLITRNVRNKILLSNSNILNQIVQIIADSEVQISFDCIYGMKGSEKPSQIGYCLAKLASDVALIGMSSEELRFCLSLIFDNNQCKTFVQDLILYTINNCNIPPYFQVEPSLPYACGRIVIEDYGRQAPPQTGYTFLAWINIERFDRENDIPLFTMVDNAGQERLGIYVEKKTRLVCIRTLKTVAKLGEYSFPEKRWVHLAIIHQKPLLTASHVYFYINGQLKVCEKCGYLGTPGSIPALKTYIGSSSAMPSPLANYSVFIGPLYFIGEVLLDAHTISIIYDIGFEYTGNWQGSWAAYLIGNKKLQKQATRILEEEANSPIFNQLATFAMSPAKNQNTHSLEIPEECFWVAICSQNHVQNMSRRELPKLESLAEDKKNLLNVVFNGGHSKSKLSAYGTIEGALISLCPKHVIEGIWTLGGCAILLRLADESQSSEELHKNLSILVGCVNNSWRNLAEMERGQLYEIMSFILKSRKEYLSIASLDVILSLVGKNIDIQNDTMINNPSAIKHLVLDIELWRTSVDIQRYYLNTITDLIVHSSRRNENIHTLNKMAIIKRYITMIENQIIDFSVINDFLQQLKLLVKAAWSADVIRLISTCILNTLPKYDDLTEISGKGDKKHYAIEIRHLLLQMTIEIIEEKENNIRYAEDLINAVSVKWILLFLSPRLIPKTIALGARLFYCTWSTIEYPGRRFKEAFVVMRNLILPHYAQTALYLPVLGVLFEANIPSHSWAEPLDHSFLITLLKPQTPTKGVVLRRGGFCSEMFPALIGMLSMVIRTLAQHENDKSEVMLEKCSSLSELSQIMVGLLGFMYLQFPPLREIMSTADILAEFFALMFSLVSSESIKTVDHVLESLKNAESSPIIVPSKSKLHITMKFVNDSNDSQSFESRFISNIGSSKQSFILNSVKPNFEESPISQTIDTLLELIMTVVVEVLLEPGKSIPNVDFIQMAIPFSSPEGTRDYEEFIILATMNALSLRINRKKTYLQDQKTLGNIVKYTTYVIDSLERQMFEGDDVVLDFVLMVTKYAWEFEEQVTKGSGKNSYEFSLCLKQLNRATLIYFNRFSMQKMVNFGALTNFLCKLQFYQQIIHPQNNDTEFQKCIIHHLLHIVFLDNKSLHEITMKHWKQLVTVKSVQIFNILKTCTPDYHDILENFSLLLTSDGKSFFDWLTLKKHEVCKIIHDTTSKSWEDFCASEVKYAKEAWQTFKTNEIYQLKKRKKRLDHEVQVWIKFTDKTKIWFNETQTVFAKMRQKFKTDYKLMQGTLAAEWGTLLAQLGQEHSMQEIDLKKMRLKLDFTEAKARIRKKMRKNEDCFVPYQSKAEKIMENLSPVSPLPKAELRMESSIPAGKLEETSKRIEAVVLSQAEKEQFILVESDDINDDIEEMDQSDGGLSKEANDAGNDWEEVKLEENQNIKIQRLLQSGDVIVDIVNCARLVGLELIEGIALICQHHIYIVDNYFSRADGEVLDLSDVPLEDRNIYHLIVTEPNRKPGETPKPRDKDSESHTVRVCSYNDIKEVHKRLYLFRNVAFEMFLADGRNFFLTFWSAKSRDAVYSRLLSKAQMNTTESVAGISNSSGLPLQGTLFGSPLADLTQKWQNREISNLAYLMHLNTLAGRSYNDLTQYPTFPWILSNYESEELNLEDPTNYRDLSRPMGGQGSPRAEQFAERYNTWDDPLLPGCHYGTHYSSSMIVCGFLIRMEPFTGQYLKLQGGHFDHPDRIFHSIPQSWISASKLNTTDVRELIPEFFYLSNFLENTNGFNFGNKQTGESIDTVILPKWAKNNPRLFIKIHREALESEVVSNAIHSWIDLVFGYKQQGEEAAKALNVFHYLSYEGAVDIDLIEDPVEKQSTISIIHNFGQTPKQLFKKPHPKRNPSTESPYRIEKNYFQLIPSVVYLKDLHGVAVSDMVINSAGQLVVIGPKKTFLPGNPARYLEWGFFDHSLRILQLDNHRRVSVFESLHIGQISDAVFADGETLVTGGEDKTVCIWSFINGKKANLDLLACMRGHRSKISCLAASRSFSIIVSGSEDCTAIIWDLNRHHYSSSLMGHNNPISTIHINQNNGDIITCDVRDFKVWDINGNLICSKSGGMNDSITACTPFEGKSSEIFDSDLIFTGHKSGLIRIWQKVFISAASPQTSSWEMRLAHTLSPSNLDHSIELIWFPPSTRFLLSANSAGQVLSWMLPESGTEIHYAVGETCLSCSGKLAVLGRKANCRSCGGLYCSNCVITHNGTSRCNSCQQVSLAGKVV